MTLFTTPMITNQARPAFTPAPKMYSLAMKPTVGGTPVRETMANASTAARSGALRPMPAKPSMRSLPVRLDMAMTAENAARFIRANPPR